MDTLTVDIVLTLSTYLDPHGLLNLALSCKRFGGTPYLEAQDVTEQQKQHEWSLIEEAARRRVNAAIENNPRWRNSDLHDIKKVNVMGMRVGAFSMKQSVAPRNQKRDSWMAMNHRLYKFQTELVFYRLVGDDRVEYVNRDPCHVQAGRSMSYESLGKGGMLGRCVKK